MAARRTLGFTLIELMIAVVIVAILASIALPSYRNYVLRANRTVAKTTLVEVQSRQESFYVDRKRYAASLTALGYPADPMWITATGEPETSAVPRSIYRIDLDDVTLTGFSASASPVGSQEDDARCGTLTVIASGRKSASGSDGLDCWR